MRPARIKKTKSKAMHPSWPPVIDLLHAGIELARRVDVADEADVMHDQLNFLIDACVSDKASLADISRLARVRQILFEPFEKAPRAAASKCS